MLLADIYKIPVGVALGVIAGILAISVVTCIFQKANRKACPPSATEKGSGHDDPPHPPLSPGFGGEE